MIKLYFYIILICYVFTYYIKSFISNISTASSSLSPLNSKTIIVRLIIYKSFIKNVIHPEMNYIEYLYLLFYFLLSLSLQ